MVTLPTYNEAENITDLINELLALSPYISVVVIDDNSPDGTHEMVRKMQKKTDRVFLIHRTKERGRGSAGVAGFKFAVEKKADLIIEMDADYSHHPRFIPPMIKAAEDTDIIIGSRLIKGGGETGRNFLRTLITHGANLYIRLILGLSIKDCTTGYRIFKRKVLESIDLDTLTANGPAIVQEVLLRCKRKGFSMKEVPILFEERRAGTSTFNIKIMITGLISVLKFRFGKY
jgi:dolichol-phosphate mannosyltransferase